METEWQRGRGRPFSVIIYAWVVHSPPYLLCSQKSRIACVKEGTYGLAKVLCLAGLRRKNPGIIPVKGMLAHLVYWKGTETSARHSPKPAF